MVMAAKFLNNDGWAEVVARQDHIVSRSQAAEHGVERYHIARRVAAGTWQRVGPHVVVLHGGPLSTTQKRWAAVLHGGSDAALFGLTALEAAGLRGHETAVQHVVARHGHGRRDLRDQAVRIEVHESIELGPSAIHPLAQPRRQRVERAAVDAAARQPTDGTCRAVIAAVVQQGLVRADDLRAYPQWVLTVSRRRLILETIDDVAGGAQSLPEIEWSRGIRRVGLPEPTRQRVVKHPGGRYYLDADFDPWRVTVEINGAQHLRLLDREYDDNRRFALSSGGRLVVDIASYLVRHDIDACMLRTARALHSRGWQPDHPVTRRLAVLAQRKGEPLWLPRAA
jgi:hypothetical protein